MKQSSGFFKTRKDVITEAESINYQLLVRGGFVNQLMAGVYTFMPLGLRVLKKIENIIREEMVKEGGEEILMPVLQPKENWEKTGRWETMDDLFRFTSYYGKNELALGPSHEEVVVPLAGKYIFSYKDLPRYVFQIQTKFRDEKRAKSGVLRAKEFLMKDLYSFHTDEKNLNTYYEKMTEAYYRIFERTGIGKKTYLTFAGGGSFSKFSHEFQAETTAGEDLIYLCEKCRVAVNEEIIDVQKDCPKCNNTEFKKVKTVEVGNIFKLRTRFSKAFDLKFTDNDGSRKFVEMGCYGIGLGRLMGTVVEVLSDSKGIIWPKEIAPYQIHLISLGKEGLNVAKKIYVKLIKDGWEVLWDDREEMAGVKFADSDLFGIPFRLISSDKLAKEGKLETKLRQTEKSQIIESGELNKVLISYYRK